MLILPWPEVADSNQEWERRGREMETLMLGATGIFRHIQQNPGILQNQPVLEQGKVLVCVSRCCSGRNRPVYTQSLLRGKGMVEKYQVPYISELKQGTNRSLVLFTSLVISSDNVNRGLVLLLLLCLIYKPGHN